MGLHWVYSNVHTNAIDDGHLAQVVGTISIADSELGQMFMTPSAGSGIQSKTNKPNQTMYHSASFNMLQHGTLHGYSIANIIFSILFFFLLYPTLYNIWTNYLVDFCHYDISYGNTSLCNLLVFSSCITAYLLYQNLLNYCTFHITRDYPQQTCFHLSRTFAQLLSTATSASRSTAWNRKKRHRSQNTFRLTA